MLGHMRQKFRQWRRSARARESEAYDAYTRVTSYPLFVLGLLFLIAFAITLTANPDDAEVRFARFVIPLTWLCFAIDYAIGILLAPHRWHFVRTHVVQAIALLFPPLRVLMLFHVFHVLRSTPMRRGEIARIYVLYATTLLLVISSLLVVFFERQSPDSNIRSFGDALWWGGETVSTVGYGDYYPVTVPGRLVAAVLFINGVALLSVITAGLAQNFTAFDAARKKAADASTSSTSGTDTDQGKVPVPEAALQELHAKIDSLEQAVRQMSDLLASGSASTAQPVGNAPEVTRRAESPPGGDPPTPT